MKELDCEIKFINHEGFKIYTKVYGENKPHIILLHGFPDNSHLYDLLVPQLTTGFQVITFDFLGWGKSDKPKDYGYSSLNQKEELNAVISKLNIKKPTIVAHDASGPPAIDWAVQNGNEITRLILLNTYYSNMPTLSSPEAIWLFSIPVIRNIARFVSRLGNNYVFEKMYFWQVGKFFNNDEARDEFVPILFKQFQYPDSAQYAFFKLNSDLLTTVKRGTKNIGALKKFEKPVLIIFGGSDKYLNSGVAEEFHKIFRNSKLHIIDEAKHFVQMDAPVEVADLIKNDFVKYDESTDNTI